MKKKYSHNAMTLTELLIASAMIGIVITGALSADFAIRTWQKRIEDRTMVQMDLAQAMEQILKAGKATVGHSICEVTGAGGNECEIYNAYGDIAFVYRTHTGMYSLCFRQTNPNHIICYFCTGFDLTLKRQESLSGTWKDVEKVIPLSGYNFFDLRIVNNRLELITINLCTRPKPRDDIHPLTNPEYCLSSSFLPTGLSQ